MPVNTLDLHGESLIDDEKLARIEKTESSTNAERWESTFSLAGRDLTGADLSATDVRHTDFSGGILNRAKLDRAWAERTRLDKAQLQGTSLDGTRLQSASLNGARLQNALLDGAPLQGASLDGAHLQGASLVLAQLQGAVLRRAQLQAASLLSTQLQGAVLDGAQLQGALLDGAPLQGASLNGAQLQGASLKNICAWRADARYADWKDTQVVAPTTSAKEESPGKSKNCTWTAASFEELKKLIIDQVPEGHLRREVTESVKQNLDPTKALEGEDEMAKVWAARATSSPTLKVYERSLAEQWRKTGCAANGAPYVLRQLIVALSGRLVVRSGSIAEVYSFSAGSPETLPLPSSTRIALARAVSRTPTWRNSMRSVIEPLRLWQTSDAKFRRDQIALLPLRW